MTNKDINILYVEDEANVREMFSRFLKRFSNKLYVAENGVMGIELYKKHKIDIVISDIKMPKMNGLEMIKAIKSINPDQLVLLLSAHSDSQYLIDAINLNVDGYILKPIDLDIVYEKIEQFTNIIKNRKAMEQLKESEEKFRTLTEVSLSGIFIYQEKFIYVNPAFCQITGYSEKELLNMYPWEIVTTKYLDAIKTLAEQRVSGEFKDSKLTQLDIKTKDAKVRTVKVSVATMPYRGRFAGSGNMVDITDMIVLEKKLEQLALKDALTGIYNRYKINLSIENEITRANRYGETFSLIMLDIDYFKKVNDTFGHDVGDYILQELSRIILQLIRKTDCFGRWGGEEFMLLAPHTNKKEAIALANKIRKEVQAHPFEYVQQITLSIGVTQYLENEKSDTLIKRVDTALYEAKANGRNQVAFL